MTIRVGKFCVVVQWLPRCYGWEWSVSKWRYMSQSSWRHGRAYLGRFKVMW